MPARRWLPPPLAERARAFVAGGLTPAEPRPAATVILLRDAGSGLEAYVLRRRSSMAFAAGMHAFPGGSVDELSRNPNAIFCAPNAPFDGVGGP